MDLEHKWEQLKSAASDGKGLKTLRLAEQCILELFIAIDNDNRRYLILHLPEGFQPKIDNLENENILLTYSSSQHLIAIKLLDIDFSDLFDDLINSMFSAISTESSVKVASKRLVDNFIKWNQFFRKLESRTYGETSILGLWGELFTLERLIVGKINASQINNTIEAWTGPLDSVHDFTFADKSIEIKTKLISTNSINVSSEFQLELGSAYHLELCIVNVQKDANGLSIDGLYKKIKAHILNNHADLSLLIARLNAFKLDEPSLSRYQKYSYKALEANYYDCLNEEFPKIIRTELDDEIYSVKYKVNVSTLGRFILSSEKY
jgi:hypothetical protein